MIVDAPGVFVTGDAALVMQNEHPVPGVAQAAIQEGRYVGSVNVYDDPRVADAIEATGRKKLIFAGLSLEVCAALPAMTAVSKGLDAYVAVDACGTFSETKRQVGLLRMQQAGVILSDYATLMVEILKDNNAVYAAMDMDWVKLVGQIAQAHAK